MLAHYGCERLGLKMTSVALQGAGGYNWFFLRSIIDVRNMASAFLGRRVYAKTGFVLAENPIRHLLGR